MRKLLKKIFKLYDMEDLQVDALCGICGTKHKEVVETVWPFALCRKCRVMNHDFMKEFKQQEKGTR